MDIKTAIECVKDKYESYDSEWCAGTKEVDECYKEQNEIIALLKELEKYREDKSRLYWFFTERKYKVIKRIK